MQYQVGLFNLEVIKMTWHETKDWGKVIKVDDTESHISPRRATMEEWEAWLNRAKRDMDIDDLANLFMAQTGMRPPVEVQTTKWTSKPVDPDIEWESKEGDICPHCGKKTTKFDKYAN